MEFSILVGWVGLKTSFSIKIKNKKHGLNMPKSAFPNILQGLDVKIDTLKKIKQHIANNFDNFIF